MKEVKEGYKMTELGEIPNEWNVKLLNEVSSKIGDGLHGTPKYSEGEEYYFINGNNLVNGKILINKDVKTVDQAEYDKNNKELTEDSILISLNGTIGNLALYNNEKVILGKSAGYITLHKDINKKYVFWVLKSEYTQKHFIKSLTGTTIKNLSLATLRSTIIPVPPIPEQQKIADILSIVDEQIDNIDRLIEKTKELKKGLMQQLLTKGIGHMEFKETEVGVIPKEWEVKKLSDLAEIKRGASPRPIKDPKWFSPKSNVGWIRISDVTKTKKYLTTTEQYLSDEGTKRSRIVNKGDLIMSICATVGKPIILDMKACIHDGFVMFDKLDQDSILTEYLFYLLQRKEEEFKGMGQTGTQANLNTELVGNTKLGLPKIKEQIRISLILSKTDQTIQEQEAKKIKLQQLKKGLMQQLLTGKTRVKTDEVKSY